eukprot:5192411-Pleurochrysis_carterae.AAC.3
MGLLTRLNQLYSQQMSCTVCSIPRSISYAAHLSQAHWSKPVVRVAFLTAQIRVLLHLFLVNVLQVARERALHMLQECRDELSLRHASDADGSPHAVDLLVR